MAIINLRIDEKDKKEFNDLCDCLGLSMSTAINIFIKQSIRNKRLPLDLSTDSFYSESNIKYLEKKLNDYKDKKLKLEEHVLTKSANQKL